MKKLLPLLAVLSLIGCTTLLTPASIQSKAKGISFIISANILKDKPELKPAFVQASSDLKYVAGAETIDVNTVMVIIQRLPKLQEGDAAIYIEGALIIFSDELNTFAVKNPPEVRAAATGFYQGIDQALGFAPARALKSPLLRNK